MRSASVLIEHVLRTSKEVCAQCMLVGRKGHDLSPVERPDSLGEGLTCLGRMPSDHLHGVELLLCIKRAHSPSCWPFWECRNQTYIVGNLFNLANN